MAFWLFKKMYFSEIHRKPGKDTITGCTELTLKDFNKDNKNFKKEYMK